MSSGPGGVPRSTGTGPRGWFAQAGPGPAGGRHARTVGHDERGDLDGGEHPDSRVRRRGRAPARSAGAHQPARGVPTGTPRPADPLRPLAVGEVLDGAMDLLRRHPGPTLGVGAVVAAVQLILTVPVFWIVGNLTIDLFSGSSPGDAAILATLAGIVVAAFLQGFVASVCASVAGAPAAAATGAAMFGQPVRMDTTWAALRPRAWRLLGLGALLAVLSAVLSSVVSAVSLIPFVGLLVALATPALVATLLGMAVPVFVLERAGVFPAVQRSVQLVGRGFLRVFWVHLLARTVGAVLQAAVALPFFVLAITVVGLLSGSDAPGPGLVLLAVTILSLGIYLPEVVVLPFLGCVNALVYADSRMRTEGLDIDLGLDGRSALARTT